jgi:UPF0755 protein
MSRKSVKRNIGLFLLALVVGGGFGYYRVRESLKPTDPGKPQLVRYEGKEPLSTILHDLEKRGVIRSASALGLYARVKKKSSVVEAGTYEVTPGMTADEVLKALSGPVTRKITIPEYYWISRTAEAMEKGEIAKARDFEDEAKRPADFKASVSFPLPKRSLEGYLFPDTYKMQPLVGAKPAIEQLLQAFDKKVWKGLGEPKNLQRAIIIASMVEREVKEDDERPIVAGIIENRLAKGMPLEIDATILYAQQDWHEPTHYDIRHTMSPYNTYLNKGLPPGPICSPGLKSIKAALNPAHTNYLYYVGMPDGHSLFAATFPQHQANIAKRRIALRAEARHARSEAR